MKTIYAFPQFDAFMRFVIERHRIYERRAAGQPAPWTKDPILRAYRFCNVYRELDRVTLWIANHWRGPYAQYEHLWFAMVIARLVNRPETLALLACPGRWNKKQFLSIMHARQEAGEKTFGSAYIVSTGGKAMNKAEYLAQYVLDPLWKAREIIRPRRLDSLHQFFSRLTAYDGLGSFMAAQIVADMKYVDPLVHAIDWWTFASSGPGSRRGMSYVMGKDPRTISWREKEWREALSELSVLVRPVAKHEGLPRLHNQDLQNCLCEFSKYARTVNGTGRPKQKFIPHA
jgi:hypothetical protein